MKKKQAWTREQIAAYFRESRELEDDRKPTDQVDLNVERLDSRRNARRRVRKVRRSY